MFWLPFACDKGNREPMSNQAGTVAETGSGKARPDLSLPPLILQPASKAGEKARGRVRDKTRGKTRHRNGLGGRLVLVALAFVLVALAFELSGKPIRLPVFLVADVENRLNTSLREVMPGTALSVGGIEIVVGADWVPHLSLEDVALSRIDGPVLLTLPDTELTVDPEPLLSGQLRARSLKISGASVTVHRDAEGRFDFAFGAGQGPKMDSLGAVFAALDKTFASPAASGFKRIEANALSLTFEDAISGRTWALGDGHFVFENRDKELAVELGVSLIGAGGVAAEADVTAIAEKGRNAARITATVDHVAAADLAAQTPVLGFLAALDAPISGRIFATLDTSGVEALDGRLEIGAGAVRPSAQAEPLAFDHAAVSIGYSPRNGQVRLGEISVQSRSLRMQAQGQAYLVDGSGKVLTGPLDGRRPAAFLGQVTFDNVQVDPAGLFAAPVEFSQGALEMKLSFAPFRLDLGQFSLAEGDQRLVMSGHIQALPDGRLESALDLSVNQMSRDRLLALWPPKLVTGTRNWIVDNLTEATLTDIRGALRQVTGAVPKVELGYGYKGAVFKFMKQMPPVTRAEGYATIQDKVYTLVMDAGVVTAPQGGTLDMTGSMLQVPDIMAKPATGNFRVKARGSLTASLSILDQPPFEFLTKAGRKVDLGQGTVVSEAEMTMPLIGRILPGDVQYTVKAVVTDFRSDQIVPGKTVTAARLDVQATAQGMRISGPGFVGAVPVDVVYAQEFGPNAGPPVVDGTVELGPVAVKEFQIGLPAGTVKGLGLGTVHVSLPKGEVPVMTLTSDTKGLVLAIPEIGWKKSADTAAKLDFTVVLDSPPRVPALALTAPGLSAAGSVTLTATGGLDVLQLPNVKVAGWFDGPVDIRGQGGSKPVALDVLGGRFDLRKFPEDRGSGAGGADGGPLTARLHTLQVTDGIALTRFSGNFSLLGGFNGTFQGLVNGKEPVAGNVAPSKYGTAVHLTGADAGAVARATGMYSSAYGGDLDMTLIPREGGDSYDGSVKIGPLRVRYDSVIADLLNAVSVVGLLQQLNGPGIAFENAEGKFVLTPTSILLQKASAIGASMGISLSGLYHNDTDVLDMQGVVSPIYLLNGIGSILTRRGEGLFGFSYKLKGSSVDPQISVNPLSILTPGMFREIFRSPPPTLPGVSQ